MLAPRFCLLYTVVCIGSGGRALRLEAGGCVGCCTQACLDYPEPPPTAEGIKTWRKSLKNEPGKVIIHPGLQGDMQPEGRTYECSHFIACGGR